MAIRRIITLPDPLLRKKAHKVTDFGKDFQQLVNDMIETMREAPGVGLAAPQIAVPQRLIVVEFGDEEDEEIPQKLYVLANPEITLTSDDMLAGIEGCLSVPDLVGEVERYRTVTVRGLDRHGKNRQIKAEGWLARIFQHEIDHLDGILYPDRANKVWKPAPDEEIPRD